MAVSRIWFPAAPVSGVDAADRALLGIGYGGITISDVVVVPSTRFMEAVPSRPSAADGFYSEGTADGFYDEYPSHGFYARTGYEPEMKPFHRATYTMESVPSATFTTEGKPN